MARRVIIDCDPGIDDAVALCVALFDPRLEVVAVTAVEGNVSAELASRNVQTIVDYLDPPRLPRVGAAVEHETPPTSPGKQLHGSDGLGNCGIPVSQLHHQHSSEKIICDEVRAAPNEITIIALGPLTNIARAFQRDPQLPTIVDRLIIMGGSVDGIGNVTPVAEHNVHYDPASAQIVFDSPTTKTLAPLDVTRQAPLTLNLLKEFPDDTRIGSFLHHMLQFSFRAYHQQLGLERIFLHDVVALIAALQPELFQTEEMQGNVETAGDLTTGMTVFDRRPNSIGRANMEVALEMDVAAVTDCIARGLRQAAQQ